MKQNYHLCFYELSLIEIGAKVGVGIMCHSIGLGKGLDLIFSEVIFWPLYEMEKGKL